MDTQNLAYLSYIRSKHKHTTGKTMHYTLMVQRFHLKLRTCNDATNTIGHITEASTSSFPKTRWCSLHAVILVVLGKASEKGEWSSPPVTSGYLLSTTRLAGTRGLSEASTLLRLSTVTPRLVLKYDCNVASWLHCFFILLIYFFIYFVFKRYSN